MQIQEFARQPKAADLTCPQSRDETGGENDFTFRRWFPKREGPMLIQVVLAFSFVIACAVCYGAAVPFQDDSAF